MAGGALGQVQKAVSQTVEARAGVVMTQFLREFGQGGSLEAMAYGV